jgi:hypothetical protein
MLRVVKNSRGFFLPERYILAGYSGISCSPNYLEGRGRNISNSRPARAKLRRPDLKKQNINENSGM